MQVWYKSFGGVTHRIAGDWYQGTDSALYLYATKGIVSKQLLVEIRDRYNSQSREMRASKVGRELRILYRFIAKAI